MILTEINKKYNDSSLSNEDSQELILLIDLFFDQHKEDFYTITEMVDYYSLYSLDVEDIMYIYKKHKLSSRLREKELKDTIKQKKKDLKLHKKILKMYHEGRNSQEILWKSHSQLTSCSKQD